MHATPNTTASPWYTHRWPWFLMLGPATVLVGGAFAAWLALGHPDAMVVDDYYKQGRAINQDLRRERAASVLHLALHARYAPGPGRLEGRIESFGQPLAAPFTLRLNHPTQPGKDLVLQVPVDAQGRFSLAVPGLEPTHWQVSAEGGRQAWRLAASWDWAQQAELVIDAGP